MEKQTKNLGHVTAYGYAKSQGYEGTEAEYAELMASYATVAERAEAAADEAEASAQEVKDVIPEVTAQDNGKVMMVENGEWGAGEVDVLPTVTTQDNGKVLGVVEGQWAKTEPEDGLPEVTSSDNGKVLSVVEGAWAPAEPTGGLPEVTSEDNGDLLSVVDGAWAKSEPGYRVEDSETVIAPEQSVTTVATYGENRVYTQDYTELTMDTAPETLRVTWNGTEYTVPLRVPADDPSYGEFDSGGNPVLSTYPFALIFYPKADLGLKIITTEAGTYTIAISAQSTTVTLDDNFKLAVKACGAPGYDVGTEEVEIAAEQSVTTAAQGSYNVGQITATAPDPLPNSINVTFNGTSYENVPKHAEASLGGVDIYGDIAFSEYPFVITFAEGNLLLTQAAGTYTIAFAGQYTTVTPGNNFKAAVAESGIGAPLVVKFTLDNGDPIAPGFVEQTVVASHTYDEILAEYNKGRPILFDCYLATGVSSIGNYHVYGSPVLRSDNKLWLDAMFPAVDGTTLHIFNVEAIIGSGDYLAFSWHRYTLTEAT